MRIGAIVVLGIALSACGTRYQEMGFTGGVEAQQITSDTYRIVARGNSYTGSNTIKDYALLKAAETTKAAGQTHFVVITAEDASRASVQRTSSSVTTTVSGNMAFSTINPGSSYLEIKPGQDAYIRVLSAPVPGAYLADEIIQYVGSRVQRD